MSDQGVIFTHTMMNTLIECIAAEETFVGSLEKMLKSYSEANSAHSSSTALFSSSNVVVVDEGSTLSQGWEAVIMQQQRVSYLHKEFGSLLAEPVSLSLGTMKAEYNEVKLKLDGELQRVSEEMSRELSSHLKLVNKMDTKVKELATCKSTLSVNGEEKEAPLQRFMESPVERSRKLGTKVDQLHEETIELCTLVEQSQAVLNSKIVGYREDIQNIVSLYMKNEKYRLDVKKSSLRSLVKANEHLVHGLLNATHVVLLEVEKINSSSDIKEFIERSQVPWEPHHHITPILHDNPILTSAISSHESKPSKLARVGSLGRSSDEGEDFHDQYRNDKNIPEESQREETFGASDLQKNFNLPPSEQVVNSFSCALYINNFPHHGRLYLSQGYLCFTGWRESYLVLPLMEITNIEKKNTALVVPNGMEIRTEKQGKLFFASFIFRDECLQAILQLIEIKKQTRDMLSPAAQTVDEHSNNVISAETNHVENVDKHREEDIEQGDLEVMEGLQSILLHDFDTVLDQTISFSVDFAFEHLWRPQEFLSSLLVESGETFVSVGPWDLNHNIYAAFNKPESFFATRCVTYTHNKKYMVGPSSIPTAQIQRYKYMKSKWLVISVTSSVSDAPYHDYFRAESRWFFTSTENMNECRLRTGVRLFWNKSTWLKKQIENATSSESKETMKYWIEKAVEFANQKSSGSTESASVVVEHVTDSYEPSPNISNSSDFKFELGESKGIALKPIHEALKIFGVLCILLCAWTLLQMFFMMRESLRLQDVLYGEPEPVTGELIVQVQAMRGSNLFEIVTPEGKTGIAMLPTKYRKLIWIRRGDYLIVGETTGDKKGAVNYMVEHILYKEQIKHLKKKDLWPAAFTVDESEISSKEEENSMSRSETVDQVLCSQRSYNENDDETQNDPVLFVNRNRMGGQYVDEDDDDDSDGE
ncbi:Aste57867_8419 [Aphanomyces stellatus]|uniref:Aste57867_8419 protein n=1 Tax=Aphanomyces stellatus TaxID=120398 RepID=A0A485KK87_9STRA|nr:hypothetical protein As57867_008387 [Aphanomyces stellatus]VFT85305.1 Aste57867_8419 [Aphanomyces stellatus]